MVEVWEFDEVGGVVEGFGEGEGDGFWGGE